MRLYLVRHGEAVPQQENPNQPLNEKGRRDVQRMASFLARSGLKTARVIHSGKARARDTALLLAEVVGPGRLVEEAERGLAPGDSTDALAEDAAGWNEDVMVVGHMPHLSRAVARLLTGAEDGPHVDFRPGAVACLERDEDGAWSLAWMVSPELLGA